MPTLNPDQTYPEIHDVAVTQGTPTPPQGSILYTKPQQTFGLYWIMPLMQFRDLSIFMKLTTIANQLENNNDIQK